jgi:hypothetical protein
MSQDEMVTFTLDIRWKRLVQYSNKSQYYLMVTFLSVLETNTLNAGHSKNKLFLYHSLQRKMKSWKVIFRYPEARLKIWQWWPINSSRLFRKCDLLIKSTWGRDVGCDPFTVADYFSIVFRKCDLPIIVSMFCCIFIQELPVKLWHFFWS